MGQESLLIGLSISLAYYAVLNSSVGGGATLGKRLLSIRVITRDGHLIGLPRSLLRAVVLQLPFYLNGLDLSFLHIPGRYESVALVADAVIVFAGAFAIVYLYVFNRRTRQALHDLIAGTFVVASGDEDRPVASRIRPVHLVVVLLGIVAIAGAGFYATEYGLGSLLPASIGSNLENLQEMQADVVKDPDVLAVPSAMTNTTTFFGSSGSTTTTTLAIVARVKRVPKDPEAIARRIAARVLTDSPSALGQQNLSIAVRYGFSIGIASGWYGNTYVHTPAEWRAELAKARRS